MEKSENEKFRFFKCCKIQHRFNERQIVFIMKKWFRNPVDFT